MHLGIWPRVFGHLFFCSWQGDHMCEVRDVARVEDKSCNR
jgi:hypothetical protein